MVKKLERPPALITNKDACTKYLSTLDNVFARRVCRAVEEREIIRVLMQQLGIDVKTENGHVLRKEDVISLQEVVQVAEAITRTDVSYLWSAEMDRARGESLTRTLISVDQIPEDGERSESHGVRSTKQHNTVDVFALHLGGDATLTKDRVCVVDGKLGTSGWSAGEDINERINGAHAEISALTQYMRSAGSSIGDELDNFSLWCRDQFGGLWKETAAMGDELDKIRDEMCTVQRQLKDINIREAAAIRNEEIYLEMDMLGRRRHVIEDSSSQDLRTASNGERDDVDCLRKELFNELSLVQDELRSIRRQLKETKEISEAARTRNEGTLEMDMPGRRIQEVKELSSEDIGNVFGRGQESLDALREEMRNNLEMVQDELRTIQTRLRRVGMCEAARNQEPWDSEQAPSFLQNWLREETRVERRHPDADESPHKKRVFMPLLTKKQRKVLERAAMAREQPRRSPNRKNGKQKEQKHEDELKARTDTVVEGRRCDQTADAESGYSEDSEVRHEEVDIEQEKHGY
ncbi:hypothetical protein B0H12DRAFT_1243798 [Mycena haematopus]|nr:hypothetical protein B0H12DRAFT_1243798 [Mycena haematopus]